MSSLVDRLSSESSPETETVVCCPLCGSRESKFIFWAVDRLHHLPGRFGVVQCNGCGLVRLSPRPKRESLPYYYPESEYYSYSQLPEFPDLNANSAKEDIRRSILSSLSYPVSSYSKLIGLVGLLFKPLLIQRATFGNGNRIPNWVPGGCALDVGCGSGLFLSVLKQLGWNVQGVELSEAAAVVAKEKLGIDVFVGNLRDARFANNQFDFISFNHSLEHLPDIRETLNEASRILKPGGTLYVEVPNVESFSQRISRQYWLHWDAPRHLFGFSSKSLRSLLEICNFTNIQIRTIRADFSFFDIVYRREDSSGEKLKDRSRLRPLERLHVSGLKLTTALMYLLDRKSGDYISCIASKKE